MKMRVLFLCTIFCIFMFPLFGQEENQQPEDSQYPGDTVFVINSFVFNVDGHTRPFALINKGEFVAGQEITGFSNLEKYIQDKTQLLLNQRVLESARIDYSVAEVREDGKYPVDLVIYVKDTWNLIAIPRPQYSSNSGFDITIKARDYNFLGTMSALRLDLGYQYDEEGRNFFTLMLDSDTPFRALGLTWNINFDNDFEYRPDMSEPFYFRNVTGLSVELPAGNTTVTTGFDVSFIYNDENSDGDKPVYGDFMEGLYISVKPFVSFEIPLGLEVGAYGELTYTPKLSATFNFELPDWPLDGHRIGPFLDFSHGLGFGRIDWIGNFLRGYSASINNSFSYNFHEATSIIPTSTYYGITGTGHFIFLDDRLGLSTRVMFRHWINTYTESGGDVLRGILDKDIKTDYMLSLNLDLPIRVLRIRPSEWFNNRKARILNFDLHINPIIDVAMYNGAAADNNQFGFDDLKLTGGLEMIIFPNFFRSLFLRISLGFDFSDISNGTGSEIFIGTELHY